MRAACFILMFCAALHGWGGEAPTPVAPATTTTSVPIVGGDDEAGLIRRLQEKGPRDTAIEKGVAHLLAKQNRDGSFGQIHKTALTGLAVMSLMAAGHTPDSPQHGPAIRSGIQYVLGQMRNDGYFGQSDNSRMYGHGMCTLMLTEAVGQTEDPILEKRILEAVRRAVDVILKAQAIKKQAHFQGGWRYEPTSVDSDLSLTGWQTMALRSAKNIGIEVPAPAIASAVDYIRAMSRPNGEFSYDGGGEHPSLRGIGLLALPVCGVYDAPELARATAQMLKVPPKWQGPFFYYSTYYASVGMYQMGDDAWRKFHPVLDDLLLKQQKPDGSWPEPPGNNEWDTGGSVYSTAMALLTLAVHYHLLPIYQR